ncbi:MAG: SIR2 family protein [Alphaproteobacteria bacterium]|nr:SIR2 family protein [Alphaproteobacteria bacterium]
MSNSNNLILPFDAFVRSFKQNKDVANSFLIGAGTSITSGIQSAADCVWEWKKDIYCSNNVDASKSIQNYKIETVQKIIQEWLDKQGCYPKIGDENEYSFYAEKAYPIEGDRVKYFTGLSKDKSPYIGYKLLCLLNRFGVVKSVWSTNFDGLVPRAAQQLNITPIEINLDNEDRIYRNACDSELLYIALHGDYKYSKLKNTSKELDTQSDIFANALKRYFVDKNLIVCGYSGRDKSLMDALTSAFSEKGSGRVYWCGYGEDIPKNVSDFLLAIKNIGREVYYIPTDGFDKTLISLTKACVENDSQKAIEVNEVLQCVDTDESHTTEFHINHTKKDKYIKSNLYPILIPKETFVLDIGFKSDEHPWKLLKDLIGSHPIIAVPFKKKVYAFSTSTELNSVFGNRLKDTIRREPISFNDIRYGAAFKNLYLSSILYGLASRIGLNTDRKHKIWKTQPKQTTLSNTKVYEAIECDIVFPTNQKYALLSVKPSLYIDNKTNISKDDLLKLSMSYINPLRNKVYDDKLIEWEKILFGNDAKIIFDIPSNSQNNFKFSISRNRAFASVSVLDSNYHSYQANGFDERKLIYNGAQLLEPQLEFVNNAGSISKDYHPMRGLTNHKPYDSLLNERVFSQAIDLGVICPDSASSRFYSFLNNLNRAIETDAKSDYVIDYNGFYTVYNVNINIPNVGSDRWCVINELPTDSYKLSQDICKKIEDLYSNHTGIVIAVFIPKRWNMFKSFKKDGEEFDLHDYIKAFAAQRNITTQIIEETTIDDTSSYCQIFWWLSLAFYVKAMRTPWTLANMSSNTAFAGIGYGIKKNPSGKIEIVLGCSHIYNAKGEGLKYKLSKVDNPLFDRKNNPYLTYDEAFKFGVSIRELFMQSMNELPQRVVVHKRTPFKPDEIKGITDALKRAGIDDVDLIEINIEDSFRFMAQKIHYGGYMETDGFPLSRGTCIQIAPQQALLWTHGIVPSVKNNTRNYYAGGRSIPAPLKIVKHYGKGDLYTIANEILGFTKMNWNSFNLYTKLPATLDSSSILARVGKLLSKYEGKTYDYRYFI